MKRHRGQLFRLYFTLVVTAITAGCSTSAKLTPEQKSRLSDTLTGSWTKNEGGELSIEGTDIGAQAAQASLLPNGLILIINGSSNRSGIDPLKITDVQNTVIFNPVTREVIKIPATPEPIKDAERNRYIDPFCSAQTHLPNGDVLMVGGTKRYDRAPLDAPTVLSGSFLGTQEAWIFNWKKINLINGKMHLVSNPWKRLERPGHAPALLDGRYYPTVVTLGSGEVAVWGGYTGEKDFTPSTKVEIYDPRKPDAKKRWTAIDWQNSGEALTEFAVPTDPRNGWSEAFDLYPRILLMPDGSLFFPGDSSGFTGRHSHQTFLAKIDLDQKKVQWQKAAERTPLSRPVHKFYSTIIYDPRPSLRVPNSEETNLLIIGGAIGAFSLSDGKLNNKYNPGYNSMKPQADPDRTQNNLRADLRVTPDLDIFEFPNTIGDNLGQWRNYKNFLGTGEDRKEQGGDGRINHLTVLLPTGEFLVLGGGSYGFSHPHFEPLLFTPKELLGTRPVVENSDIDSEVAGFRRRRMKSHKYSHLYHSTALLLPDGRVALMGGNAGRAKVTKRNGDGKILTDGITYENDFNRAYFPEIRAEEHRVEIFSPPYLFKGKRPVIKEIFADKKNEIYSVSRKRKLKIKIEDQAGLAGTYVSIIKLGSSTHSMDFSQRFIRLKAEPIENSELWNISFPQQMISEVNVGANITPPGIYMLFAINREGVPSEAKMIELN